MFTEAASVAVVQVMVCLVPAQYDSPPLGVSTSSDGTGSSAESVPTTRHALANTARYSVPFCAAVTLVSFNTLVLAPAMLFHPPPVFDCHCTVASGVAVAAATNVAEPPTDVVTLTGCAVIVGGVL